MAAETSSAHELGELIEALDLPPRQKQFLRQRWLEQVVWMDARANSARDRYYRWRLTAVIGGVSVPALVSLNISGGDETIAYQVSRWAAWAISLVVAIAASVEAFFHYGDRWRQYRRTAELLKTEGWQFFQLSGPYRAFTTHADAYRDFAARVEEVIQHDVEVYITETVSERQQGDASPTGGGAESGDQGSA